MTYALTIENSSRTLEKFIKPLHRLTGYKVKCDWIPDCEQAFTNINKNLVTTPILVYSRKVGTFILDFDALQYVTGGVSSQEQTGEGKAIGYFIKTLGKAKENYCVTRNGFLKTLEYFHVYLCG